MFSQQKIDLILSLINNPEIQWASNIKRTMFTTIIQIDTEMILVRLYKGSLGPEVEIKSLNSTLLESSSEIQDVVFCMTNSEIDKAYMYQLEKIHSYKYSNIDVEILVENARKTPYFDVIMKVV